MITLSFAFNMCGTRVEKIKMLISMVCMDSIYIIPMLMS